MTMQLDRRTFLQAGAAAAVSGAFSRAAFAADQGAKPFHMKFAPHFGMFQSLAGKDLVDQLKFAADEGFRAWEDNQMPTRSVEDQQRVAKAMQSLDIEMGTISAMGKLGFELTFASDDTDVRKAVLDELTTSIEVARRVNAKVMTVVLGTLDPKLPFDYQTANVIDLLLRACDVVEKHGITMILEPLNRIKNHPGVYLHTVSQGYMMCRAVRRPGCKLLYDIYHEQIEEGNLVPNIDRAWDEIAYFQCGDNPGRKEPGTGEINYRHVFQHIQDKGWKGIMGLEHGNSKKGADGERAVIAAYRAVDPS
jgi:hydroxypyruvate isomerase